ncbi:hypothetical protein SESBI_50110 [Sesbania bispinosa]|nr:hypothetical protein SESBI_50110 [Sesbania bispinosa]
METREQACVEGIEWCLSSVETRVQDLLQAFGTLQDTMVKEQQEQSEFRALFAKFLKDHGRCSSSEEDDMYPKRSQDQFKNELMEKYSGLEVQNPYKELAALRQRGSVQEYIDEFKAMQLALNLELALHKGRERTLRTSMGIALANHWINVGRGPTPTKFREGRLPAPQINNGEHSVSDQYGPLHKCPNPKLRVMILGEDETLMIDEPVNALEVGEEEGVTLKLICEVSKVPEDGARLGDGCKVLAKGPCTSVEVVTGNYHCCVDAWVMELGGVTVGDVVHNWDNMTMQFNNEGKLVEFKGDVVHNWDNMTMQFNNEGKLMEFKGDVLHNWEHMTMQFYNEGKLVEFKGFGRKVERNLSFRSLVGTKMAGIQKLICLKALKEEEPDLILSKIQEKELTKFYSDDLRVAK